MQGPEELPIPEPLKYAKEWSVALFLGVLGLWAFGFPFEVNPRYYVPEVYKGLKATSPVDRGVGNYLRPLPYTLNPKPSAFYQKTLRRRVIHWSGIRKLLRV